MSQVKKKNVVNMSRLHLAAASGSITELDELISMKYDVNAVSNESSNGRQTPLMLAARNGHLEPVIKLLKSGAHLETQDSYGQTALLRGIRGGQIAVIRVILEHKANPDHQDHYGVTALHMAVEMDSAEMVSLLVGFGANVEKKSNNKCQFPFMTPFRLACALNSLESAQELLDLKADVDSKDAHGTTALLDALSRQRNDLICLILRHNPNLYASSRQTEGVMPLSYAAGKLKTPFLVLLVEAKADVNKIDLGGKTALHFAARTNNVAAIEYLLRVGADYTLRDKTNRDPATYGAQYGSKGAVKILEAAWMNSGGSPRTADPLSLVKQKYILSKKLGEGAFGKVLAVTHKKSGNEYACKFIKRKKLSESAEAYLDSEIQIMFEVPHPGICRLYEVIKTKQAVCLIMEVLKGGDVLKRIVEKDILDEKEAAKIVRSVASTLGFLHGLGIIHRDLKPDNLMYRSTDPGSEVVIVDFGVAKHLEEKQKFAQSACGTPLYLAPEVIVGPQYTNMCDMWSLGVILYVMLCGRPPFYAKDRSQLFRKIKEGNFAFPEKYWRNVSQGAKDLIGKLLVVEPTKRATPKQVAADPWIRKYAVLNIEEKDDKSSDQEKKKQELMAEGFASLSRTVKFLVAVKRLYHRFDLGSIDGASLRLLGAYRQGMFRNNRSSKNNSISAASCWSLMSRRVTDFSSMSLQPLMAVKVKNFEGDFVIERKYKGDLPGMKDHWWVSGSEGQMHVVSPAHITPISSSGKALPTPSRRYSFHKNNNNKHGGDDDDDGHNLSRPADDSGSSSSITKAVAMNISLEHNMRLVGPSKYQGKYASWAMRGSKDDLMELMCRKDRFTLMFWDHMRLFIKKFAGEQKEEHEMVSEAKRIQLMFLKTKSTLKLSLPKETIRKLDQSITANKVNAHIFDKAAHMCQAFIQKNLWVEIKTLVSEFKKILKNARSEQHHSLRKRLSLVFPKRLLDLMGCKVTNVPEGNSLDGQIISSTIQIASLQNGEEQDNDLKVKLHKILSSERYVELNALAKVVGEDSDLLVPGRRLYYAAIVKKKSRMVFSSSSERKLVLCNDIIAWLTPKLKLKTFLPLSELECLEFKGESRFAINHSKKTYEFYCNNDIEAKQWVQIINRTKQEWKQLGQNRRKTTQPQSEGVLSDIRHKREQAFSRMKKQALRDLIKRMKKPVEVKSRSKGFQTHANSFVGEDFVKWIVKEKLVPTPQEAVRIGNELVVSGYIEHVSGDHGFRNNNILYKINEKLVKVGDKGAAVVRTLGNNNSYSASRSMSTKQGGGGGAHRITWLECQAKIVWKVEGRTRIPHAVLCLWNEDAPGNDDNITLAEARAVADSKDPLKLRVIPGGVNVSEDESYYEEYQIKFESKEIRDKWLCILNDLQLDHEKQERTIRRIIDRAENVVLNLETIQISKEETARGGGGGVVVNGGAEAKRISNGDGGEGTYWITAGGDVKKLYVEPFLQADDFPHPSKSRAELEEVILQSLNAYFTELVEEVSTDSISALWKLLTTNTRFKIS